MNTKARNDEFFVKREDWLSHGYTHPLREEAVGSKLSNDIHSMFSYELDDVPHKSTTKARWGELTLEEYELLDQPLRLATQWLESAPSSDAICSIIDGDRHISPGNLIHKGIPVFEFSKHGLHLSIIRERAGSVLKRLGKSIMFCLTDRDEGTALERGTHGRTHPISVDFPQGVAITDNPGRKGLASVVLIDQRYLNTLNEMLIDTLNKEFQILKLYFELTVTICHEVIHALDYALESDLLETYIAMGENFKEPPFNEPLHEGQLVAELGFFWENHVFGGACNQSVPVRENPLFVSDWPSWMFRDKKVQPERAAPRKISIKWLVSTYYIQNSQTQEFWDKVRLQYPQDLLALRIRKRVGIKQEYNHDDDWDKTWDPDAPENHIPTSGNMLRVLRNEDDPSPCARLANETRDERAERLDAERRALSPGRDPEYLNFIDPNAFGQ